MESTTIKPTENSIPISELENIRCKIEAMNHFNQVEVLRILQSYNIETNENKNGNLVNLSLVDDKIIHQINKYITYVNEQELTINEIEKQKEEYKSMLKSEKIDN